MPYVKVWIHLVWSTKNRIPFLKDDIRPALFQHIRDNAKKRSIFLDFINGCREHVHSLISLGTEQTIADIVRLIKGESSHWINQQQLTKHKFQWQHEYFAVGVSEWVVDKVRDYIRRQEDHHSKQPFEEEFQKMIQKFGFKRYKDDEE